MRRYEFSCNCDSKEHAAYEELNNKICTVLAKDTAVSRQACAFMLLDIASQLTCHNTTEEEGFFVILKMIGFLANKKSIEENEDE